MKINKLKLFISSVIIILPIFLGIFLWNRLPESVPSHWNLAGEVDDYMSRGAAVFLMPLFLLAVHLVCLFATKCDKGNREQNEKVFSLLYFITPAISFLVNGFIYATALGKTIDVTAVMGILFGIIFIVIGNYLPKAKRNHTIGIRIPWTLKSEANWNATHRLAGRVWFAAGFIMLAVSFLPSRIGTAVILAITLISTAIPTIYSYRFHKKEKSEAE